MDNSKLLSITKWGGGVISKSARFISVLFLLIFTTIIFTGCGKPTSESGGGGGGGGGGVPTQPTTYTFTVKEQSFIYPDVFGEVTITDSQDNPISPREEDSNQLTSIKDQIFDIVAGEVVTFKYEYDDDNTPLNEHITCNIQIKPTSFRMPGGSTPFVTEETITVNSDLISIITIRKLEDLYLPM